jgi:hypothetical protein
MAVTKKTAEKKVVKKATTTAKEGTAKAVKKTSVAKAEKAPAKVEKAPAKVAVKAEKAPVKKATPAKAKVAEVIVEPTPKKTTKKSTSKEVEFRIYSPASLKVAVAGSFNEWSPENGKMKKSPDGFWSTKLKLNAGEYEYKYVYDDSSWEVDPNMPSRTCEHGLNNIITVL